MSRALVSEGIEPMIAATDADGTAHLAVPLERATTHQGVRAIFFRRQWHDSFQFSHTLARWLDDQVCAFHVVHIHGVFSHPCIAAARACRRRGVPYVVRPFGSLDPWSMRQSRVRKKVFWHLVVRGMLSNAAAVHYTTSEERRLAERRLGLRRGVVIPLGIGSDVLESAVPGGLFRERWPQLDEQPYILFLSRLHSKKGIDLLINAFLDVAGDGKFANWRLVIGGDGDPRYLKELKRLAHGRGGASRVVFAGWLSGDEKLAALRGAEVFALPSFQENFGVAVVEALASGVPALVSQHVNLAEEIVGSESGWVAPMDRARLGTVLADIIGDQTERQRRGVAGKVLARTRFTWPPIARQLAALYAHAARRSPTADFESDPG